jgi:hypothetical protein
MIGEGSSSRHKVLLTSLVVLLLLNLTFLALIDLTTFKPSPGGGMSGNGNPGLLIVFAFIPLYISLLGITATVAGIYFYGKINRGQYSFGLIGFLFGIGFVQGFLQSAYGDHILSSLGGSSGNPRSMIYGWPKLNQYTNTMYFNVITFSLGLVITILISYVTVLVIQRARGRIKPASPQ